MSRSLTNKSRRRVYATPELLKRMACQTPEKARWYEELGWYHCDGCYAHCGTSDGGGFSEQLEQMTLFEIAA